MADTAALFDYAPISLWYEDFSALKRKLDGWRAGGVSDLRVWLEAEPARLLECWNAIRVMAVNRETLALFAAADLQDLSTSAPQIFHDEMGPGFLDELVQLWESNIGFAARSVNFSLDGRRIDIRLRGCILPGHEWDWSRVIIAIEDITAEEEARRQRAESEARAQALFEQSPVSLWVHDLSRVKQLLDDLRSAGVSDLRTYIAENPGFVESCIRALRVRDINQQTLKLYGAGDKAMMFRRMADVLPPDTWPFFVDQLVGMFSGYLPRTHETVQYSLAGERLDLVLQFSFMPGHELDWSMVLVGITDITARKKAEASLAYMSRHDVATGLHNRAHFTEEVQRLDLAGPFPVSVIIADLNGLKEVNDRHGHAAGDQLIHRAAAVLQAAAAPDCPGASCTARIGGDEFVVLLPGTKPAGAADMAARIGTLVAADNRVETSHALSLSIGHATAAAAGDLESAIREADLDMYRAKRAFYTQAAINRRK